MLINIELLKWKAQANRESVPKWSWEETNRIESEIDGGVAGIEFAVTEAFSRQGEAESDIQRQEHIRVLQKCLEDAAIELGSLYRLAEAMNSRRCELEEQESRNDDSV